MPPTQHATEAAEEESDRVFSKLLRAIEKQRCDVKEAIRGRERAALAQTEQLLEKLERETAEVRRSEAELEKLCRSDDHLHFLQVTPSHTDKRLLLDQVSIVVIKQTLFYYF